MATGLLQALSPSMSYGNYITYVMRLGNKVQNKARPLRVVFNNPYVVKDIIRLKHKLKSNEQYKNIFLKKDKDIIRLKHKLKSNEQYKNIFLKKDETAYQREMFKKCQEEVDQRKMAGESNLSIRYVKGIPKIITGTRVGHQLSNSSTDGVSIGGRKNL
ncbi:hypothetical protein QE152_g23132 [Popillia japonica]|uniref:Uncharacterized protein n=1 Tax=Popillia japonica TaxID=7064 RepID=A0AAW1KJD2_POPJA